MDTKDRVIIRLLNWLEDGHYGLRYIAEQEIKKEFGYEVPTDEDEASE